ncbi:MAG: T9SS type A sorting domain-containing protein, partial [Bacteroidia bacterium]|nr:T9SS type A sorting domain-containing protein [Bacteroidia bacterium]
TFGQFLATDALTPLPVKLVTFIGKASNKNADLMWQTATEKNASMFEVYAAVDGKNYHAIGEVKAKGNTNSVSNYNFTDINALANNNKVYYKLKMIDVNGEFEWSNIVVLSNNNANQTSVEVYPNPFNNNVTVSLTDNTKATIEIVSVDGVNVYNTTANTNKVELNLNQLSQGVYFVKVTQNGNTSVQKLVKQ